MNIANCGMVHVFKQIIILSNMKLKYSFSLLIAICLMLVFNNNAWAQTLPNPIDYQGYRIELIDIVPHNAHADSPCEVTLVNSGKFPVTLGKALNSYSNLFVMVEDNPIFAKNPDLKNALILATLQYKLSLQPGQLFKNIKLTPVFQKDYKAEPKSENKITKIETLPDLPAKSDTKPGKKATKTANKEKKAKVAEEIKPNTEPSKKIEVINTNTEDGCPDLIISEIKIVKDSKNYLKIKCTIKNIGTAPAPIHEYKKNHIENISLAAYFSASDKMSRGSLLAGGLVINKGLNATQGMLLPGKELTVDLKISQADRSRYLNSLIISIDSRQLVYECVENNNNNAILLK